MHVVIKQVPARGVLMPYDDSPLSVLDSLSFDFL